MEPKGKYVTKKKRIRQLENQVEELQNRIQVLTDLLQQSNEMLLQSRPNLARSIERDWHQVHPEPIEPKQRAQRSYRQLPLLPRPDLILRRDENGHFVVSKKAQETHQNNDN